MTLRAFALSVCIGVALPAMAQDRDQTLADIRQELSVLWFEVQRLNRELVTTGGPTSQVTGESVLDRVTSIETELSRLIARTEELENRIDRIVADGTNRIGDLEFRLVELEGGDLSQLGETSTLGGEEPPPAVTPTEPVLPGGAELAVGEQVDFDAAMAAYETGDFLLAAELFGDFSETYSGGPLAGEAHFWRGEALSASGDTSAAARAYLESFSGDPQGMMAPDALLRLGLSLDALGQRQESCVMLGEVTARFPASAASLEAQAARGSMGCV